MSTMVPPDHSTNKMTLQHSAEKPAVLQSQTNPFLSGKNGDDMRQSAKLAPIAPLPAYSSASQKEKKNNEIFDSTLARYHIVVFRTDLRRLLLRFC